VKRSRISFITAALLTIGLVTIAILTSKSVFADHFIWTAADTNAQWSSEEGYESFAFRNWTTILNPAGDDMLWWVIDSELESDFEAAFGDWESAISELTWAEGNENNWNMSIELEDCSAGVACANILEWEYDGDREVNYWWRFYIYVDPDAHFDTGGLQAAISHEIGHAYGLADRYVHSPPGCSSYGSPEIMDGMVSTTQGLVHCDGITGPYSTTDVLRAELFFSDGQYDYLSPYFCCSGYGAVFGWEDYVWAEYEFELHFFWWNGAQWVEYLWDDNIYQVGTHYAYNPGYIEYLIDRRDYEEVTGAGWHVLCGYAWFTKFNSTTDWECSGQIYLY